MKRPAATAESPRWLVIVSLSLLAACLVYFGRNAIAGYAADPGPPKKVYPGMYDLRAEAAKMRAAQESAEPNVAPK